jgi:hypothetical protein
MVFEGTLDEFIREFSAKPIGQHHLYDVSTGYQPAFEQNILSPPDVTKIIARGFSRTSPMHRRRCRAVGVEAFRCRLPCQHAHRRFSELATLSTLARNRYCTTPAPAAISTMLPGFNSDSHRFFVTRFAQLFPLRVRHIAHRHQIIITVQRHWGDGNAKTAKRIKPRLRLNAEASTLMK